VSDGSVSDGSGLVVVGDGAVVVIGCGSESVVVVSAPSSSDGSPHASESKVDNRSQRLSMLVG